MRTILRSRIVALSLRGLGACLLLVALGGGSIFGQCNVQSNIFDEPDGTSLLDYPGTPWTIPPTAPPTQPPDAFTTQNSQASVGNTGGETYIITTPANTGALTSTATFSGTFTMVGQNDVPYKQAVQYSDALGNVTASYGIDTVPWDTVGNTGVHKFFGALGSHVEYASTATYPVLPNTPYFLFGEVNFNYGGAGMDRMRVWVNPTYPTYVTEPAAVDFTVAGPGSLGTVQAMLVNANTDTTKTFADLTIGGDQDMVKFPRLQLQTTAGSPQIGFEQWQIGAPGSTPSSVSVHWNQPANGLDRPVGHEDLVVTITPYQAGQNLTVWHNAVTGGVADALRSNGVEAPGGLELRLHDFIPDTNLLKTYHYQSTAGSPVDVFLSEDGGASFTKVQTFTPGTADEEARLVYNPLDTTAGLDVVYRFIPQDGTSVVGINGVTVVPEPGTLALLAAGLTLLAGLAWRRHLS